MSVEEQQLSKGSDGMYLMLTTASLTGVNPVTLRAWERHYGLIQPQRTNKGQRLYTEQDVAKIRRVPELLQKISEKLSQTGVATEQ
jgi:DNA-binding transcriptional MerR regulator